MFDYETLRFIWWLLIGVILVVFMISDGFDMGIGCLLPLVARNDDERRIVINSCLLYTSKIGPFLSLKDKSTQFVLFCAKVSLRFINNTFWRRAPVQKDELSFSASHVKRWFALLQGRRLPTISARCPAGVARRRDVRYE